MHIKRHEKRSLIFLTGFMGSGKSTIGPILANTLGYSFIDLDEAIANSTGRSIRELFETEGEEKFREIEKGTLAELSAAEKTVVALGGGTITSQENFDAIRASGVLVYLKISPAELAARLSKKDHRPLFSDATGEQLDMATLQTRVTELFSRREPFYRQADVVIDGTDKSVGHTVDEAARKLIPYLR